MNRNELRMPPSSRNELLIERKNERGKEATAKILLPPLQILPRTRRVMMIDLVGTPSSRRMSCGVLGPRRRTRSCM